MELDKDTSDASRLTSHVEDEINLLDYLIVLLKRKKLIIGITLGVAIMTAIISLILPPIYMAERKQLLQDVLGAETDKDSGIITISVEDKDPKRAADMANAFVEELKNLTKGLAVTEASQSRLFFEVQLKDTKMALVKAEEEMQGFQEKTGALQVDAQTKAVIEGIAMLRAQIAAKEVQLKVMRTYATAQNPDFQRA